MFLLRSLIFYTFFFVGCILFSAITLVLKPFMPTRAHMRRCYRMGMSGLRQSSWLLGIDYVVEGEIPEQPVVYASNHQSAWETFFLPDLLSPIAIGVKRELLWIPVMGQALLALHAHGINRAKGGLVMRKMAAWGQRMQRAGVNILIFPEGTRYPAGTIGPFLPGAAMLSKRTGMPLVPVALDSGAYFHPRTFKKNPGTIRVVIGEPIDPAQHETREMTNMAREWITETMSLEQVRRMKKR